MLYSVNILLISRLINDDDADDDDDDDDDGITYEKNSVLTGLSFFWKARGYLPLGAVVYLDYIALHNSMKSSSIDSE